MSRILIKLLWILLPGLVYSCPVQAEGRAEIRFFAAVEEAAWVGEQRDINLELWTGDLSFSEQSWVLPDVPGAFLIELESGSVKLSETRDGSTWQGLRYTLSLFPQRAGVIEIPSFEVRFSTREGYLSPAVPRAFRTPTVSVEARLPEGADPGNLLVTTPGFMLEANWEPSVAAGETLQLQTGDALVLNVKRQAQNVPAMVFAPLPEWQIEGLGVYSDLPQVGERVNRGDLSAERSDRITVVCEQPGSFRLPEIRFQWWDPRAQELHDEVISAVSLEVIENPAWGRQAAAGNSKGVFEVNGRYVAVVFAVIILAWPVFWLLRRLAFWLKSELKTRKLKPLNP